MNDREARVEGIVCATEGVMEEYRARKRREAELGDTLAVQAAELAQQRAALEEMKVRARSRAPCFGHALVTKGGAARWQRRAQSRRRRAPCWSRRRCGPSPAFVKLDWGHLRLRSMVAAPGTVRFATVQLKQHAELPQHSAALDEKAASACFAAQHLQTLSNTSHSRRIVELCSAYAQPCVLFGADQSLRGRAPIHHKARST